ncbi:hypothetical protein LCGC14_2383430 [marine sediment metagenome]|uniref:Uncharacterized protein n=1 Tax=marine sediment metagenome TaxID=412755 RepID=A0A0F9C097_9ZZZZ
MTVMNMENSFCVTVGEELMSDSKKPTLSEIRAREQNTILPPLHSTIPYLLDLVSRMGKMVDNLNLMHHSGHHGLFEDCDYPKCRRVRALLDELKQ